MNEAFTLIELLVVIAIIAVLMGLLFPAGQSAINSANKTTAKNQAVQIATAITAYETEYGRYPTSSVTSMSGGLLNELCTTNNPRGIIFLEANAWKKGKGGTNTSGFCDPFGSNTVYQVAMDTNYANTLSNMPAQSGNTVTTTTTMNRRVGVWTIWTNRSTVTLINSWD
jgi:prepilin-type N-terminal cleavage/methylation domain-containing protein